jgi:UDP-glucose 4-epimerase
VHVSDVADAHILADEYLQTRGNNQPTLFNLGVARGYTILEVIDAAQKELNVSIQYTVGPRREGDPRRLVANSDSARHHLNFKPKHNLQSILRTAYNWYERQRQ